MTDRCPDVVILACDDERTAAIERLAQQVWAMGSKVLLLLPRCHEELFDTVAKVSTDGFLILDQLTTETLNDSLQKVCRGDVVIPPQIGGRLLAKARAGQVEPTPPLPDLTPRERQALQLLVGGLSNKQIATQLQISSHGAKRLVANVLAKLNCPNRTLAVAVALQYNLVKQCTEADH
ncbi:LuxR C-terminal-related transcriptional regulator [Salinactinospora qingdaonensis]|uniref:Response regulator transcription factor n=1 Tax=Salinactinospora qingdaonensis TaxID=702744 RepID=A0ABP7GCY8_9ACTN